LLTRGCIVLTPGGYIMLPPRCDGSTMLCYHYFWPSSLVLCCHQVVKLCCHNWPLDVQVLMPLLYFAGCRHAVKFCVASRRSSSVLPPKGQVFCCYQLAMFFDATRWSSFAAATVRQGVRQGVSSRRRRSGKRVGPRT